MSQSRKKFLCLDCHIDTGKIGEHYMLIDTVWEQAHNSKNGMLCIDCIELRLKRKLSTKDFNNSHVNRISPCGFKSVKLLERIKIRKTNVK